MSQHSKNDKTSSTKADTARAFVPVIGLAGGIGSGKSLVASELGKLGCAVIDVDRLAKQMRDLPATRQVLRERLGEDIFTKDGQIDEKALAELVFGSEAREGDKRAMQELNAIIHPLVKAKCREMIDDYRQAGKVPAVVLDAPLLFEAGLQNCCETVIFIACDPDKRSQRVQTQRGWDETAWLQREKTQILLDKKLQMSDYTVENNSSKTDLRCHIRSLLSQILGKTRSIGRSVQSSDVFNEPQNVAFGRRK